MLTYAGLKPAAEHVDLARDVEKTAAEQSKSKAKSRPSSNQNSLTALGRPVLTPEDLWHLPKIAKSELA